MTLTNFVFYIGFYFTLAAVPVYVARQGAVAAQVGLVGSAMFLATLLGRPLAARLVAAPGRGATLLAGAVLSAGVAALYPWLGSPLWVAAGRALHGLALALFTTAATVMVADAAPAARRGEALGVFGASANAAAAFGPAAGLAVAGAAGFGVTFAAAAAVAGAAAALAVALGLTGRTPRAVPAAPVPLPANGAAGTAALVRRLGVPALVLASFGLTYAVHVNFVAILVAERGIPTAAAGLYYTLYAAGIISARLISGRLSDRRGRGWVIVPGNLVAGLAILALAGVSTLPGLLAVAVVYGLGAGHVHPGVLAHMVDLVPAGRRDFATAAFYAAFEVGVMAGGPLFGAAARQWGYSGALLALAAVPTAGALLHVLAPAPGPPAATDLSATRR